MAESWQLYLTADSLVFSYVPYKFFGCKKSPRLYRISLVDIESVRVSGNRVIAELNRKKVLEYNREIDGGCFWGRPPFTGISVPWVGNPLEFAEAIKLKSQGLVCPKQQVESG